MWSEYDPIGARGLETTFTTSSVRARLVLDCQHQPRKLEIDFPKGTPPALLTYLRPFARLTPITDELACLDREGYFRLFAVPSGVKVTLRQAASPTVIAELVAQLERAAAGTPCPACVARCPTGALHDGVEAMTIDDSRCSACLKCVRHHVEPRHLPPPPQDEAEGAA